MNIRERLELGIDKNSKCILYIFPNERLKTRFRIIFNPFPNYILLTTQNLEHKLDGLRYREYKFIDYDFFEKIMKAITYYTRKMINGSGEEPKGLLSEIED